MTTQAELETELSELNELISSIQNAQTQEFWDGAYRHRAPELPALYAERRELRKQIAAKANSGSRVRRVRLVG